MIINNKHELLNIFLTDEGKRRLALGTFNVSYYDIVDFEADVTLMPYEDIFQIASGLIGYENCYLSEKIFDESYNKLPVFECYTNEFILQNIYDYSVCGINREDGIFDFDVVVDSKILSSNSTIEVFDREYITLSVTLKNKYDNSFVMNIEVEEVDEFGVDYENCYCKKYDVEGESVVVFFNSINFPVVSYVKKYIELKPIALDARWLKFERQY